MSNGKPKPKELSDKEIELLKQKAADLPAFLEYAHNVGGFSIVPTNQGLIKSQAQTAMIEQTDEQLKIIFDQMQMLAKQVKDIKDRVSISEMIYQAEIPFVPVIGKIYYLYEKENQVRFLSIISPVEWGEKIKDKIYLAEVRLNADHTWKIIHNNLDKQSY